MAENQSPLGSADRLFAATEIDALEKTLPAAVITLAWVRQFLAKPHPDLGRPGPVCPFVQHALNQNTIWMQVFRMEQPTTAAIEHYVGRYRDIFLTLEPNDERSRINKTILLIFPDVCADDAPQFIDGVKYRLKRYFVEAGLMLGEFHERNPSGGLHNPDFRPLRSPIPMLAIRYMVEGDLPFLMMSTDTASQREAFLRAWLDRFGTTAESKRRQSALDALATALEEMGAQV